MGSLLREILHTWDYLGVSVKDGLIGLLCWMDLTSGVDTSHLGVSVKDACLDSIQSGTEKVNELALDRLSRVAHSKHLSILVV